VWDKMANASGRDMSVQKPGLSFLMPYSLGSERRQKMWVRNFSLGVGIGICLSVLLLFTSAGPTWADNAKFYGTFEGTQKVGSCDQEDVTFTVGDDVTRRKEDNYLFVIPDSEETSFSWLDDITFETIERTTTVNGDSIGFLETGGSITDSKVGWTKDLSFAFSDNFKKVGLSGTVSNNDDEACQGNVTGNLTKEEEQDNAKFYGTFDYTPQWFGPGECPETGTLRIGNDYTRTCEEDYLYIPASGNRAGYDCTDNGDSWTSTVSIVEDVITWEEIGECEDVPSPCWEEDFNLSFGPLYDAGQVSGFGFDWDPEACQGVFTGNFERVADDDGNGKKGGGGGSSGCCFISTVAHSLGW